MKPNFRGAFRTANLGARYELGAARVAEQHFATPASRDQFKFMVVKINSHVGVRSARNEPEYGMLERYQIASACCGALDAMLQGGRLPAIQQLRELFRSGGRNRLHVLANPQLVEPKHRALAASIVNARLQAQQAALDIEHYRPETPTVYLILPCVTLNRSGPDTELVVGQYGIDWTERAAKIKYDGLGDDPGSYRIRTVAGRLHVEDERWLPPRAEL
jgi:hypothetical protein